LQRFKLKLLKYNNINEEFLLGNKYLLADQLSNRSDGLSMKTECIDNIHEIEKLVKVIRI